MATGEPSALYVLERFLFRVGVSPFAYRLVLKGGLLLAALDARSATRDADLLATQMDGGEHHVRALVGEIASIEVDEGVLFDFDVQRMRSAPTREGAAYVGVRYAVAPAMGQVACSSSAAHRPSGLRSGALSALPEQVKVRADRLLGAGVRGRFAVCRYVPRVAHPPWVTNWVTTAKLFGGRVRTSAHVPGDGS